MTSLEKFWSCNWGQQRLAACVFSHCTSTLSRQYFRIATPSEQFWTDPLQKNWLQLSRRSFFIRCVEIYLHKLHQWDLRKCVGWTYCQPENALRSCDLHVIMGHWVRTSCLGVRQSHCLISVPVVGPIKMTSSSYATKLKINGRKWDLEWRINA